MERILVIKGPTMADVVGKMTDDMAEGFRDNGYEVVMLDLRESNEVAWSIFNDEYLFIFSFQALLINSLFNGKSRMAIQKNKYIGWFVDDIMWHTPRVEHMMEDHMRCVFIDARMKEVSKLMYPELVDPEAMIVGGLCLSEAEIAIENKDIDILFPANVGAIETIEESFTEDYLMPIERWLIDSTISIWKKNPELSMRGAFDKVWQTTGEPLTGEILLELLPVMRYIEQYIRAYTRITILESLLDNGYTVHVIGNILPELKDKYPDQLISYGVMDVNQTLRMMQRSKVLINPFPPVFEEGLHDRIYTSMLQNAICFTPYSKFQEDILGDRIEYINMLDLYEMNNCIQEVLSHYDDFKMKLEENYNYAKSNHTWQHRAKQLLDRYIKKDD